MPWVRYRNSIWPVGGVNPLSGRGIQIFKRPSDGFTLPLERQIFNVLRASLPCLECKI